MRHSIRGAMMRGPPGELSAGSGIDVHISDSDEQQQADIMFEIWKSWIDAAEFGFEAQRVIAMRLMKIAAGGPAGLAECRQMVEEKFAAAVAAQSAGAIALVRGKSFEAATGLALVPVRRSVRANHRRLSRG